VSTNLGELVNLLTVGTNHSAIYFPGHPRVAEAAEGFANLLEATLAPEDEEALFLGVVDGKLVHEGKPLLGPTLVAKRVIDAALLLRSGGFLFQRGTTADEMRALFGILGETKQELPSLEDARRLFYSRGIYRVVLSPVYGEPGWLGDGLAIAALRAAAIEDIVQQTQGSVPVYQRIFETVETAHAGAASDRNLDVAGARGVAESFAASLAQGPSALLHLTRYPDYDSYTVGHSVRVALLAVLVGQRLGFPAPLLAELGAAGLLHDVGKGKIRHEILFKRGVLNDEERRVMGTHTVLGAQILLQSREASPLAVAAAFGHHVRFDRCGYPRVALWHHSSRLTSLLQVCDVFEALTAVRPYKPALTPRRAYEIMLKDPGAFDPAAFGAFVRAVGFYPPGARVRMTTGEEAMVLRAGAHPARPVVQLLRDAGGATLSVRDRRIVDLGQPGQETVAVEETLLEDDDFDDDLDDDEASSRPGTFDLDACGHDADDGDHLAHHLEAFGDPT
jgi:putative nucleotidyltransferase with HDIG domain